MAPDAETMGRISKGIRLCAEQLGGRCETLVRLAVMSERARAAGIGKDGRVTTQEQAEVMLGLLRDWWRDGRRRKQVGQRHRRTDGR